MLSRECLNPALQLVRNQVEGLETCFRQELEPEPELVKALVRVMAQVTELAQVQDYWKQ